MATLVGQGFERIGTRFKPGQTQAEFYDTQSDQVFGDPNALAGFVNSNYGRNDVNADNVFSILSAGFTPRAQALDQITGSLNKTQNDIFDEQQQSSQRKSSEIQKNIDAENKTLTDALAEFKTLKERMGSLGSTNYEQTYNDLRTKAGIPGLEGEFAGNQKSIRELPYVNRQNFGNAGVATEGQLTADTEQKGIPLEIQQANLLDRLKLAGDFVNNSLKFKEMDTNAARESIGHAIDLVLQSVNLSRQQISDYQNQQDRIEARAAQFTKANGITQRFYRLPGSTLVFDSQTMEALPFEEYKRRGGIGEEGQDGEFADVQEVVPQTIQEEHEIVKDLLMSYPDAGITLNDSLSVAQSKISGSQIYADKVRGPVGRTSTRRSPNSDFTDAQLAKGAAAAGMSISEFSKLSEDEQNDYINGPSSSLEGGKLDDGDFEDFQNKIDEFIEQGIGLGEIREMIDNADIPQDDKEELKQYAEDSVPEDGLFTRLLKKLNPFD